MMIWMKTKSTRKGSHTTMRKMTMGRGRTRSSLMSNMMMKIAIALRSPSRFWDRTRNLLKRLVRSNRVIKKTPILKKIIPHKKVSKQTMGNHAYKITKMGKNKLRSLKKKSRGK
jgi:hypothetical protein